MDLRALEGRADQDDGRPRDLQHGVRRGLESRVRQPHHRQGRAEEDDHGLLPQLRQRRNGALPRRHQGARLPLRHALGHDGFDQRHHRAAEKYDIVGKAQHEVDELHRLFEQGFISHDEQYNKTIDIWSKASDEVTTAMQAAQNPLNPVFMMATSGARGSIAQVKQLGGMRGLMSDPSGRILEIPVKASLKEGLTVLEYFISTHGARKGLADTALRTADSGYLTRRLVDVAQDVIIREEDCGSTGGITVSDIRVGKEIIEPLIDRIIGRRCGRGHPPRSQAPDDDNRLARRRDRRREGQGAHRRRHRRSEDSLGADVPVEVRRLFAVLRARSRGRQREPTSARRWASSPRSRSVNRARSSRCEPSTPAAWQPKTSSPVCRVSKKSSKRASPRDKRRSPKSPERCGSATSATSASSPWSMPPARSTSTTSRTARISRCRTGITSSRATSSTKARSTRTTFCASKARPHCRTTWCRKCRRSIARRASTSTTSTSK